jgi:hypothetical protein
MSPTLYLCSSRALYLVSNLIPAMLVTLRTNSRRIHLACVMVCLERPLDGTWAELIGFRPDQMHTKLPEDLARTNLPA